MNAPPLLSSESWQRDFALLEEVFDAVVLLNQEGQLTWANAGFANVFGFGSFRQVPDLLVSALAGAGLADFRQQLQASRPVRAEAPFQRADGSLRWMRLKLQPLAAPTAEAAFIGLLEDISEWKQTLLEREEQMRYLTEHIPGVLFQWRANDDGTSGISYIGPQLHSIFGLTPGQALHLADFVHPDDRPLWFTALRQARKAGGSWSFEGRLQVPGQPLRWCRGTAACSVSDASGRLYSGILLDISALKKAEETVQANEDRWRSAIERFGDGAWEFNYQTGEEYFSETYRTMLGYSEEEFALLPTWQQHVHPDDQPLSIQASDAYLAGRTPLYTVERRLLCKDGSHKWVLTRGLVTTRDEQGQPLIMTGIHTDISAVKQATADLEASTLRLYTTISNFQEGILLEDERHRVVLANEAVCRIFQLAATAEQLVGYDTSQLGQDIEHRFRHPQEFLQRYHAIVNARQPVTGELFVLADGRTLQCDFAPIFVENRYIGHLWKFQDITARKTSEDSLRRREEKYRGIIENMNLGLVEMDLDLRVTYVNQAFCDIAEYSREEFDAQPVMQYMLSPTDLALMREKDQRRQEGESETYELAITSKSGEVKWLLVSAAPLYDDHRRVHGTIGITLDITPQKRLENHLRAAKEQAEESARAKELFLANMSHEIRTPMNAILGMGQLLAKTPLNAEQQNYLRAIATSGENLLVILNDILDLSKIGASQLLIERIGFSVTTLLKQVEKSLHFRAEEKGLSFGVVPDERLPAVLLGDPYRITQVLLNLANNAIKFTEKGAVAITCELLEATAEDVLLRFEVADTGIGIDADYLVDIFKEFSQEDSSVTRKFGGTGLGLSISRRLVTLMGGQIEIDSLKHVGTRSQFTLRLPVGSAADLPQKAFITSATREKLRGQRILLVEDNHFNRQIAKGFLQNAGLEVVEAENGAAAVELARQQVFDAILMDVQMPIMNGLEATSYLRQQLGLVTPIIALTANAIKGEREKCLKAGMNDYLAKPFQEDELLKLLCLWTLGDDTLETAVAVEAPAPPPAEPPLYNLSIVHQIGQGDASFTVLMLESFIESCQEAIAELQAAAVAQSSDEMRAATHKLKPSLEHLEVHRLLPTVQALDVWRQPFDAAVLLPRIAETVAGLEELITHMTRELRALRAELEEE
ncbi:PAS domain S-box protein [Hymenobacter guriensis]|uniref:histidine kinase n=1 Tax=Hymenobacter guriensis TaxID=2793065 RepID=A0ABS0KYN9_9BACT|nr:PAS domain-containing hybrid sensor histidine kinase/response regulator [Hymenobacter guriensis]MBG8552987.1 PAS domain S-box protein [Hymenobacter guriensis]